MEDLFQSLEDTYNIRNDRVCDQSKLHMSNENGRSYVRYKNDHCHVLASYSLREKKGRIVGSGGTKSDLSIQELVEIIGREMGLKLRTSK